MEAGKFPTNRLIGGHVSISGGVSNAWKNNEASGGNCMQIFTANQRTWFPKPPSDEEVEKYRAGKEQYGYPVISHDSYLINVCSTDESVRKKSMHAFKEEIKRCVALGVDFLNFHPGSHKEQTPEWGLQLIARQLDELRELYAGTGLKLLLEATAGQGTNLGWQFEQLAMILDAVEDASDLGVCVDTCHIFAAGYDIRTREAYEQTWKRFDETIGLVKLWAFHLNDSKFVLGQKKDRHSNIGEGFIGADAFAMLVNDPRFEKLPMVLETPVGDIGYGPEIALLHSFVKEGGLA